MADTSELTSVDNGPEPAPTDLLDEAAYLIAQTIESSRMLGINQWQFSSVRDCAADLNSYFRILGTNRELLEKILTACMPPEEKRQYKQKVDEKVQAVQENVNQVLQAAANMTRVCNELLKLSFDYATPVDSEVIQARAKRVRAELDALRSEFGNVYIDLVNKTVAVDTRPIVLTEGELQAEIGRLRVYYCWGSLAQFLPVVSASPLDQPRPDTGMFYFHPHVSSTHSDDDNPVGQICLGPHTDIVTAAARDGRLHDLFLILTSLLNTYNSSSAYFRLEEWLGITYTCVVCGFSTNEDSLISMCEQCERDICGDCIQRCDRCTQYRCRGCHSDFSVCARCDSSVCDDCYSICCSCESVVCYDCINHQEGYATSCDSCAETICYDSEDTNAENPNRCTTVIDDNQYCRHCIAECPHCHRIRPHNDLNEAGRCSQCQEVQLDPAATA